MDGDGARARMWVTGSHWGPSAVSGVRHFAPWRIVLSRGRLVEEGRLFPPASAWACISNGLPAGPWVAALAVGGAGIFLDDVFTLPAPAAGQRQ